MEKEELLYEGKAKKLFKTDQAGVLWVEYLDQATALNGAKKDVVQGKGELNNQITSLIFEALKAEEIPSHFIEKISKTEQLVESVEIIPLEVVVRNRVAGSFSKRLDIPEGKVLPFPIVEFYYKEDRLDDPFINDDHVKFLEIANDQQIAFLKEETRRINELLSDWFSQIGLKLIDFKLEFGFDKDGKIILADEFSPDNCRLWDKDGHHMDKDVFRRDLGNLTDVYEVVLEKLQGAKTSNH